MPDIADALFHSGKVNVPDPALASIGSPMEPNTNLDKFGYEDPGNTGMTIEQLSDLHGPSSTGFASTPESVAAAELLANKRYDFYNRGVDLENIYGLQQSWYSSLGNGLAKFGIYGIGTFANSLSNIPNTFAALKNGNLKDLSGNPDGYEGTIDGFLSNSEDWLPNYMTRKEKDHPYLSMVPGFTGSANFWGNMVIKNLGFTAGAIAGAAAQDVALGMVTEGIGEVPLVASQIGKASLWLNKLLTGTNELEEAVKIGQGLGKAGQQLLNVERLGQLAAYSKVGNGFRYAAGIYGSAQTEAGVEARAGYTEVKNKLLEQYRIDNLGAEPTPDAASEIENYAVDAMNTRFGINMALLTVSNAVQFDNVFKSFTSAGKGLTSGAVKTVEDVGKIGLKEGSLDVFEAKLPATLGAKAWDFVKPKLKNVFAEGVYEEGGQYAAEKGTYDYYTRKYKDGSKKGNVDAWNTLDEIMNSTSKGLAEQYGSSEGVQNMIVGAISALVSGGIMGKIDNIKGVGKDKRLQSAINIANRFGVTTILQDKFTDTLNSVGIAKDMQAAVESGDVFQYKNLQHKMFFGLVNSRLSSDMHDVTIEQLKMLKDLNKEDFEKTFGMNFEESNKKTVDQYVDALITTANGIKKSSDSINFTFKNPFKAYSDPQTPEEKAEARKSATFEEWKTNLAYYASVAPNANSRLASIQENLTGINDRLSTDALTQLLNPESLKELKEGYEQSATQLLATINEFMTPAQKAEIKAQVKALRTSAEKAGMFANDPSLKLFDDLLNFQLNNQDATKEKVISPEFMHDLVVYGYDAEKLNREKKNASDIYDYLSDEKGFNKFFEDAEAMEKKSREDEYTPFEEVPAAQLPEFKNKQGEQQEVEIGREYQIPKTKKAKIKKLADDRFRVTAADGTESFYDTAEKAKAAADELNSDLAELSNVKVLGVNPDGTIKVEDINGNIQNISPDLLSGYEKVQTEQEKLQKFAEQVDREQDEIEKKSGEIGTQDNPTDVAIHLAELKATPWESKKKDATILFIATTGSFEGGVNDVTKPHETRSRQFLNDVKNFANRRNIKAILVPLTKEKALGLEGLGELSGNTDADSQTGFLAAVYVLQEKGKIYFVDVNGNAIKDANGRNVEVGQQVDLQQVVFNTMPLPELESTNEKGDKTQRYRSNQRAEATAQRDAWAKKRESIFNTDEDTFKLYGFSISKGIPKENPNGEKNHVGETLIPSDKISTQEGLIVISTEGSITHNEETVNYPKGRPVIQYADTIQFANNNKFSADQAQAIFDVMKAMADDIKRQADAGQVIKIDNEYASFLRDVLYWKKGKKTTNNQMHIATGTMSLYLGGNEFDLTNLGAYEDAIVSQLKNTWHNINKTSLDSENFHNTFVEYLPGLKTREWTNYQTYLLSDKTPDGQSRSAESTPLYTTVSKPTDAVPYNFEQKYAILEGLELDVQYPAAPVAAPAAPIAAPTTSPEGFKYDGTTVNVFPDVDKNGNPRPIEFTAKVIDVEGEPFVQVTVLPNASTKSIPSQTVEAVIIPALKKAAESNNETFDPTKTDEEYTQEFFANKLSIELTDSMRAPQAAPVAAAPVVAVPEDAVQTFTVNGVTQSTVPVPSVVNGVDYVNFEGTRSDKPGKFTTSYNYGVQYNNGLSNFELDYGVKLKDLVDGKTSNQIASISITGEGANIDSVTGSATQTISGQVFFKDGTVSEFNIGANKRKFTPAASPEAVAKATLLAKMKTAVGTATNEVDKAEYTKLLNEYTELTPEQEEEWLFENEALIAKVLAAKEVKDFSKVGKPKGPASEFKKVGVSDTARMSDEEIALFKEWHAANVPNIPYEILENIITLNNGEKAWGVFENGVAKFYKSATRGTEYHEIFEGIFKGMLSPDERKALIAEFKAKTGTFIDRETGRKIEYSKATDKQAKERIADDFGDFRVGKLPARTLGEKVKRFFKAILEFFKSFVNKPSLKNELFKAIDTGKYKSKYLAPSVINSAAEYKAVEGLLEQQTNEHVEDMTARAAQIIFGNGYSLYEIENLTSDEIFGEIKDIYADAEEGEESRLDILGETAWNQLVQRTKERLLSTFKISFSEEGDLSINDEGVNQSDYAREPFATNWKDYSHFAIKIAVGTLPKTIPTNQEDSSTLTLPPLTGRKENGYLMSLVNFSKAFAVTLDKLANTNKVSNMVNKLVDLAMYDSDYVRLFTRVGGDRSTLDIKYDEFDYNDWRLFINFYQTFTKQKPEAVIQYINGENVYLGAADLYNVVSETKKNWFQNIKTLAQSKTSLISFRSAKGVYVVDVAKIKATPIKTAKDKIAFLNNIGVDFTYEAYKKLKTEDKDNQRKQFEDAVTKIQAYIGEKPEIASIQGKMLGVDGHLTTLAELLTKVTNPNRDSTHFGVDGKRRQSYAQNNALSVLENDFNEAKTLDELLQARPELRDLYARGSQILKKGGRFFNKEGVRIRRLKVGYAAGTSNANTGQKSTTVKLTKGDRIVQELNQNLDGNYYALISSDGSTEWFMNMGNTVSFAEVNSGKAWKKTYAIFNDYLKDDIALAMTVRPYLENVGEKSKELRFFKDILPQDVLVGINELIATDATNEQITTYLNKHADKINESVKKFITDQSNETINKLIKTRKVLAKEKDGVVTYKFPQLSSDFIDSSKDAEGVSIDKNNMSRETLDEIFTYNKINYVINNIEYHKVLFGDPYQFAIKVKKGKVILDATKRFKSFYSPRETLFDSPKLNTFLNQNMNKVGNVQLVQGDPGFQLFKSYARTFTASDNIIAGSLANYLAKYGETNETDASSIMMDGTYREVKIKNGQWSKKAEAWHQWQMAWTRQNYPGYVYKNKDLQKIDAALVKTPEPDHTIEILKPIVSGNMIGKNYISLVLDKFSQFPIYYSMVKGTNMESLYDRMMKRGYGYMIVESGRKVGTGLKYELYNGEGQLNEEPFNNEVDVAWKSYGIQVETSYNDAGGVVTTGSQATKVVTMDLWKDGKPVSEAAKKYTEDNHKFLKLLQQNGYENLLNDLGVIDNGFYYEMISPKAVSNTLARELLKRELSENGKDTLKLDENGQFIIPFESSPAYKQIKDILYSMVDKAIVSRKTSGGAYVQAPVTLWEKVGTDRGIVQKVGNKWVKIDRAKYNTLSAEQKKDVRLTSDTLKFYEDAEGKRYCEILIPNWFKKKIANLTKYDTDEKIMEYLNTDEGRKILGGVGFRIPTQALSSMEVFVVKGFLPSSMGKTVVVPSEITTKAGSDFDIDKLNLYLKSIYLDKFDNIRLAEYKDSEEATKEFYGNVFDEVLDTKKERATESLRLAIEEEGQLDKDSTSYQEKLVSRLAKYGDEEKQSELKERFVNEMYKKSLENSYYETMEQLLQLPENFKRLVSPVSDDGLSELADELNRLMGYNESNIKNRILDSNYMNNLRHELVIAKAWVGIAATSITGHSQAQLAGLFIDPRRFIKASVFDRGFLRNGSIALRHNTVNIDGNDYISLGGTLDADNQSISDGLSGYATSFVDVAKDPYIMKIIRSDKAVSTFMFLRRIGVPRETVVMFMNQPIIQEYLELIESSDKPGLFSAGNIKSAKQKFITNPKDIRGASVKESSFKSNIKDYYTTNAKLDSERNADQHLILDEFLKYAKMAQFVFKFTQATNYDTSSFRSSDSYNRKQTRTRQARATNIISSIDEMMNKTILGPLVDYLGKGIASIGSIIKTEQPEFNIVTDELLAPYAEAESYNVSDDDFAKIAAKAKVGLVDFITQLKSGLNTQLYQLMVDNETSVATQLEVALKNYPNIQLLHDLQVDSSDRVGGAKTIKLKVNEKSAPAENMYQGMMRELRDNPDTNELYNGLVKVAIIQGAYQSPVSIINIIPIEDFSAIVKPIIDSLVSDQDVKAYGEQFLFQKNNFADDTIVPQVVVNFDEMESVEPIEFGEELVYFYSSENFPNQLGLGRNKILLLDPRYNRDELNYDIVKMKRLIEQDGDMIDVFTGSSVVSAMYAIRKAQGDLTLRDVIGYQKVRYSNGDPVLDFDEKGVGRHVYKMVNLLGDGNRASEYYLDARPSVFNNGTVKVEDEISDQVVRDYYSGLYEKYVEPEEYTPFEELFVEQPQLPAAEEAIVEPAAETEVAPAVEPTETSVGEKMTTASGKITLKDNNSYNTSYINSKMLEAMGYKPKEIGKILNSIC